MRVERVSNDAISGAASKLRTFVRTPYDPARKKWMVTLLGKFKPDIVHVHNFFPLMTPAVHEAAAEMGLPVVQTLHNYRLLCANAQFLREGHVCEKCLGGNRAWALVHRCYRGSLPGSLALVRMQNRAFRNHTWNRHVHRFIALTEFARDKFIQGGLPAGNLVVKPNFVSGQTQESGQRQGMLFVGRLSVEKGADTLISAWHDLPEFPLTIVGGGPELDRLKSMAPANVTFVGQQSPDQVMQYLASAEALILPSIWYEGFPMTVVEAFSRGVPVIASNIGSLSEIIEPGVNGAHFRPGDPDDLVATVRQLKSNPTNLVALGKGARASYAEKYTPEMNLVQLENIYKDAIAAVQPSN